MTAAPGGRWGVWVCVLLAAQASAGEVSLRPLVMQEAAPALLRADQDGRRGHPPGWQADAPTSDAGPALDWRDTVQRAVAGYPAIAGARASIDQQASLVEAARAGYRPRVQAEVTNGQQGEFGTGQVATVGLSQMLYDFGKTGSAVARERAGEERERAALRLAIDEVIEQTVHAMIEIHRHQALHDTLTTQIGALEGVEEITRLRAEAGAATRSDPLQARARVEAVQARLFAARSQIAQWRSRLETYVGPEAMRPIPDMPDGLVDTAPSDVDVDQLPALQIARARREEAQALLRNARAQRYPTISLEASANHRLGTAGERYEDLYGRRTYSNALVAVRSDLYQGGAVASQARASASALEVAEEQVRTERLLALDAVRVQREQIAGLENRIDVLERRVASIVETRALYWDQYLSLGTRNVLDLLNAEQEIGQSAEDLENARHDLWRARLAYLLASGAARTAFGLDAAATHTAMSDRIGVQP